MQARDSKPEPSVNDDPLLFWIHLLALYGYGNIDEEDSGSVQKDRLEDLKLWSNSLQRVKYNSKRATVATYNHYAGFGPATANSLRKMLGLKEAVWEEMKQPTLD